MGQELEWKYRADPERIAGLSAAFGPFRQIAMETTYYDTPDRQLSPSAGLCAAVWKMG